MRKLLLLPLLLGACVEPDPGPDVATTADEIAFGVDVDTPEVKAVVLLNIDGGTCTGTFIHPRYILTAAHCIRECAPGITAGCVIGTWEEMWEGDWVGVDGGITGINAQNGLTWDGSGNATTYMADWVWFPRPEEYDGVSPPDMAVLHTTTFFRGQVIPVMPWGQLPTSESICNRWEDHGVDVIGYSRNQVPGPTDNRRRRLGRADVTCDVRDDRDYLLEEGSNSTCKGDSGGPTLWRDGSGKYMVGGIHSYGSEQDCFDSDHQSGEAFIARNMLERVAANESLCGGASWDDCVSALEQSEVPGAPTSVVATGQPNGIHLTWVDGSSASRVRISRNPSFPDGRVYDIAGTPGLSRFLLDTWSSGTQQGLPYVYTVCSVNTLQEQACTNATYTKPVAAPPFNLVASAPTMWNLQLDFDTVSSPSTQPVGRIYRNGVSGYRTFNVGQHTSFPDAQDVFAYMTYTFRVCTVSTLGEEACASVTTDTFDGAPNCGPGRRFCDGRCRPTWQCPVWE